MPADVRLLAHDKCVICGAQCPGEVWAPNEFTIPVNSVGNVRHGGGIIHLSFGYGSKHDTCSLYAVICDSCARTLVETAAEPFTSNGALGSNMANTIDMRDKHEEG